MCGNDMREGDEIATLVLLLKDSLATTQENPS